MLELAVSADFKEKNEKQIHLKTFSTEAVRQFIKFLYGFELEQKELEKDLLLVKYLTLMGGVYNIPSLQRAAARALFNHITLDNMVEMMDFVKINFLDAAADALGDHIAKKFDQEQQLSSEIFTKNPEIAVKVLKAKEPKAKKRSSSKVNEVGPEVKASSPSVNLQTYTGVDSYSY